MDKNFKTQFSKSIREMIAQNERTYEYPLHTPYPRTRSLKEIYEIIESGSIEQKINLSRDYYFQNTLYKRFILHYATLLLYRGILIPHKSPSSNTNLLKRYNAVGAFLQKLPLKTIFTRFAKKVYLDGAYYGLIQDLQKTGIFSILDLPPRYCRSFFKDKQGRDIIEFNILYFDHLYGEMRKKALATYPPYITQYYKKFSAQRSLDPWLALDPNTSIYFSLDDTAYPPFLSMILELEKYKEAVDLETERENEEISKIVVQEIPHNNENELLFEPDEAEEMHRGAVEMLGKNPHTSVLTTYANVEAITARAAADSVQNSYLDKMFRNIYIDGGTTPEIFASTGYASIPYSLKNDLAFAMILGNKFSTFLTSVLNFLFKTSDISFTYEFLPITVYNEKEYFDSTLKAANSGYSFILPAIAIGLDQFELNDLKDLENKDLKLLSKLVPLATSFTQSGEVGAPEKSIEEKTPGTIAVEESRDRTGSV